MYNFKNPKKTKWFWLYIVLGVVLIIAAILFAPVWSKLGDWCFWKDWGAKIINLIIAAILIYYLATYLFKKVRRGGGGVTKTLTIVEFILLSLVALGCILSQFKVINVNGACRIFGLALWTRGAVEVFRAYYHQRDSKTRFPLWYVFVIVAMVTFGTYCFAAPFIKDVVLLWFFVVFLVLYGICSIVYGGMTKPQSEKSSK